MSTCEYPKPGPIFEFLWIGIGMGGALILIMIWLGVIIENGI